MTLKCRFRGQHSTLWTLKCKFRGRHSFLWTLKCRCRGRFNKFNTLWTLTCKFHGRCRALWTLKCRFRSSSGHSASRSLDFPPALPFICFLYRFSACAYAPALHFLHGCHQVPFVLVKAELLRTWLSNGAFSSLLFLASPVFALFVGIYLHRCLPGEFSLVTCTLFSFGRFLF